MSEKTLADRVLYRARKYKWKIAHAAKVETPQGWRTAMAEGWPDYTFAKAGHNLIFAELKKEDGVVDPEQWEWLDILNSTGARAIIIRPSDLRLGRVDIVLKHGSPLG